MGKFLDQLIGAGRGDENPAVNAWYRKHDVKPSRAQEAAKARVDAKVQQVEGNGGDEPGNGITSGF